MKNLILFLIVCLFSVTAFAQINPQRPGRVPRPPRPATVPATSAETPYIPLDAKAAPCQLTVANAPAISSVKLGLTPDELGKAFKIRIVPGAPNKIDVSIFSIGEKNKSALPNGINNIVLAFFDNRLFHATIEFDNVSPKKTLDGFALALSEKYNFSRAWFRTLAEMNDVFLFCPGELRFTLNNRNADELQLEMLDLKADNRKNQRRQQNNNSKPQ